MSTPNRHRRPLMTLAAAGTLLTVATLLAQQPADTESAAAGWTVPRTSWGDPNLEGIYTNKDENNTPFERPPELAGKRLADFGEEEMRELSRQRREAAARQ